MKLLLFVSLLFLISCDLPMEEAWIDGEIYWTPVGLSANELEIVVSAMSAWEISTNRTVRFYMTDNVGDGVVHIFKGQQNDFVTGVSTPWGMDGFRFIMLNDPISKETAEHELGHTIGLKDEYFIKDSVMYYIEQPVQPSISYLDISRVIEVYEDK